MAKTPSQTTQTTKQELSPEQRELVNTGMGLIKPVAGSPPSLPNVPGFDPLQTQAQEGIIGKAGAGGPLDTLANASTSGTSFLSSGDVLKADSNPYLADYIDAANRPLTEAFTRSVLPGVRGNAISAGALGSNKSGQAQGYATGEYLRSMGDTTSKILNNAYGQGLDAMLKGIALTPQAQSSALFPETALDTVGSQRRTLEQQQGQQQFDQSMLPFNMGLQLLGASAGTPGGGTTATVTGAQPQSNPLMQGLGGLAALLAFL